MKIDECFNCLKEDVDGQYIVVNVEAKTKNLEFTIEICNECLEE